METLSRNGYSLSAGVLNIGDSDWQKGQDLKIPLVDEMPFSAISLSKKEENLTLARKSDVVIVTPVPFGSGNFPNAEIIPQLAAEGIPIILMEAEQIKERDYTDGKAETLYQNLKQGQHVYTASETEILALLERLTESR